MSPIHPQWQQPALHPIYVRLLGALLAKRGVDTPALLAEVGLTRDALDGDALIPYAQVQALIAMVIERSGCQWLGLEFGAAAQIHTHGVVGHATVASGTLETALRTLARYAGLRLRAVRLQLECGPSITTLRIVPAYPLGDAGEFIVDALLVIIERMLQTLSGDHPIEAHYQLPRARPPWAARYAEFLTGCVSFGGAVETLLQFDPAALERACLTADARAYVSATQACDAKLGSDTDLSARIRARMATCTDRYPTAAELAGELHVSQRSLFRRLHRDGLSYQGLVDERRRERACELLIRSDLSIERIAEQLGYADTSNFSRTFRRWLGQTPRDYRRRPH